MPAHISEQYGAELDSIRNRFMAMGGMVETLLREAGEALLHLDGELARTAIARDKEVNRLEVLLDEECSRIIALRQPTASDLRLVMSIVRTTPDLERIGDEAQRIAKMALEISNTGHPDDALTELYEMVRECRANLRAALDAFARVAVNTAVVTIARDRKLDACYQRLLARLVPRMESEPQQVRPLLNLIWCGRSLERIGDHAKNICEQVIYLGRGQNVRHLPFEAKRNASSS